MSEDPKAQVQQLRDAELALEDQLVTARADLAAAREREASAALSAVLDGASGRTAGDSAAKITERIHALTGAIGTARAQRVAAIPPVWAAEAAALREQAVTIEAQATDHEARTQELLEELRTHAGCTFTPGGVTRGRLLQVEAAGLAARAAALEARTVVQGGRIAAGSRDELIAAITSWDAMKLAPTLSEALAWLDQVAGPEVPPGASVTLVWRDGEIDPSASVVTRPPRLSSLAGLRPVRPIVISDRPLPVPKVETFVLGRAAPPPPVAPGIRVSNPRPRLVDAHGADVA